MAYIGDRRFTYLKLKCISPERRFYVIVVQWERNGGEENKDYDEKKGAILKRCKIMSINIKIRL